MQQSAAVLFALEGSRALGERLAAWLEWPLSQHEERAFEDGEHNSPLTKSSYPEKDTSYGMTNEEWHTACGTVDRANRLRQRAAKETLKNSVSPILDLRKSKAYIAPSVHFPIFSVSP